MRIPTSAHTSLPWRIHEITRDFTIEDVWALPATGGPDDFPKLLDTATPLEFPASAPLPVRVVWGVRDLLGRWFDLGRISTPADDAAGHALPIPGTGETTLSDRLPDDLRHTADDTDVTPDKPFRQLYQTGDEYAAELSNRTVHAVMHLGWVEQPDGSYRGQMAVLVKPRGRFGEAYMALIKPFRYALVYPALMKAIARAWRSRHLPTDNTPAATPAG